MLIQDVTLDNGILPATLLDVNSYAFYCILPLRRTGLSEPHRKFTLSSSPALACGCRPLPVPPGQRAGEYRVSGGVNKRCAVQHAGEAQRAVRHRRKLRSIHKRCGVRRLVRVVRLSTCHGVRLGWPPSRVSYVCDGVGRGDGSGMADPQPRHFL